MFHLWGNIILGLSKSSSLPMNTNKTSTEYKEMELDSGVLTEVEVYDSWWNEFEEHSHKYLDTLIYIRTGPKTLCL